eukprot:s583_g11.t1
MFRSIHRQPKAVKELDIFEWTQRDRTVKDFEYFHDFEAEKKVRVVAATIGPDPRGKVVGRLWDYLGAEEFGGAVIEGPRDVDWERCEALAVAHGWKTSRLEFLTSEVGEALVRRRVVVFVHKEKLPQEEVESLLIKEVNPPTLGTILKKAKPEDCVEFTKYEAAMADGNRHMLPMVGAHVWIGGGDRQMVYKMSGPGRWPLTKEGAGVEELYVVDRAAPTGTVRRLTREEIWKAQGRTTKEWEVVSESLGPERASREGCAATGRRTALALLSVMAELSGKEDRNKAGMCYDYEDYKSLGLMLVWLRQWRRGDFGRAAPDRKAGGVSMCRRVWLWGEDLWLQALDAEGEEADEEKAGGRRKATVAAKDAEASKVVMLEPGQFADLDIKAQVEEWLDDHMQGDKAESTQKAYTAAWQKWCAWTRRQGWLTPYLNHKDDQVENENKLLGYLGYLGWLGTSVATLKQAVFAIKDAHKRAGHGDSTTKMHRLWIVLNSLERTSVKRPRRLGVTVPMLKWIGQKFKAEDAGGGELRINCRMVVAAVSTAWFFMLRAKEFCDSSGVDMEMIVRGQDVQLGIKGKAVEKDAQEVTLQFRKTKADQESFGTCKTMLKTSVEDVCVVTALEKLREVTPRRFKGPEQHLPLFRWASGQVLRRLEVQHVLQQSAKAVGLPAERFQSHSLRIGGASALYQSTGEVELVKRTGRWSSGAVHRYLHDSGDVLKGLAERMASVDQYIHYT